MASSDGTDRTPGRSRFIDALREKGGHVLKQGAEQTGKAVKGLENTVTQSNAFDAINATLEEMAFIIGEQHARISDLEARLADLERANVPPTSTP